MSQPRYSLNEPKFLYIATSENGRKSDFKGTKERTDCQ